MSWQEAIVISIGIVAMFASLTVVVWASGRIDSPRPRSARPYVWWTYRGPKP